jgi:5-methylcytosine-specific restriction endonuclease McrA
MDSDAARFCTHECYAEWRSENITGEECYQWKSGLLSYGEGWTEAKRETVRDRQNRECAGCVTHETELPRKLDVHHITPAQSFDDPEKRNDPSNLVALCRPCHNQWESMSPLRPQTALAD